MGRREGKTICYYKSLISFIKTFKLNKKSFIYFNPIVQKVSGKQLVQVSKVVLLYNSCSHNTKWTFKVLTLNEVK